MMNFRVIKHSLINKVLGPAAAGRFHTVGYQRQSSAAQQNIGNERSVQVFYAAGEFSRSAGRINGAKQHEAVFRIEMTVGAAARVNLSAINDPSAKPAQIAAALANYHNASSLADNALDELIDIIYGIVMDARNVDLGLAKGILSERRINQVQKDDPLPRGEYVVLTGAMNLSCRCVEQPCGETPGTGEHFNVAVDLAGDDTEQTGAAGKLGGYIKT
ncbi:MAG: hypothetical protein GY874_02695 [Desulfobacteraceae bacterium]|nr:hypothetical protein [Desulfobacteraceae bacterium]